MSTADQDAGFIAEALPAFISEAQEQSMMLEQLLLQLEDAPDDGELLGALFRCAHTIKGSAGMFGLDKVVAFTHHVETLLDRLRDGQVQFTPQLSTLLLRCNDQIRLLVAAAGDPLASTEESAAEREALVEALRDASGSEPAGAAATSDNAARESTATGMPCSTAGSGPWQLSVQFGADTFRNGMDPLAVLSFVAGLGTIVNLVSEAEDIPDLEQLDPENCHWRFEFALQTAASAETIEAAFSFVRDDCTLELVPPHVLRPDVLDLIDALPDNTRLGEILVSVGAVQPAQLAEALAAQADASNGRPAQLGELLQERAGVEPQVISAALRKQQKLRESAAHTIGDDSRYIRVQADRLDAVINLLGELVIAGAGAALLARQTRQGSLIEASEQVGHLIEEIRNGTLQLRMVPIGETFSRFRRVVRDTAGELGKEVHLEVLGGDTELDKSMVERIADPLMHLVRNALDHGLEQPVERMAAGKPAEGRLTLAACHEAGSILIRILDDGRGIQRERVLARARERGLVEPGVTPPDDEILQLIFEPGFSTAERVTNLSGRGVGMDVVRRNIEAIRGTVSISSEPGQGSSIEIRLPLTLAIIDGFLVGVGSSKFILPLDAVVEVIENRPSLSRIDARGRRVVELRGQVLPVVSLRALYALDSPELERSSVVVIKAGTRRYGVLVDQLLGQHQTVIKPLGRLLGSLRGMSGSTILGNGEVALIFDVNALGDLAASGLATAEPQGVGSVNRSGAAHV